jgi:hypothetical protein
MTADAIYEQLQILPSIRSVFHEFRDTMDLKHLAEDLASKK